MFLGIEPKTFALGTQTQTHKYNDLFLLTYSTRPVYKASYASEPTQAIIIRKMQYGERNTHTCVHAHTHTRIQWNAKASTSHCHMVFKAKADNDSSVNGCEPPRFSQVLTPLIHSSLSLHLSAANECEKRSLLSPPSSSLQQAICQR